MAEQKSMIMSFTFDANSVFCDTAKTALEKVCEEGKIAGSLAARFSGLKLYVVGMLTKLLVSKLLGTVVIPMKLGRRHLRHWEVFLAPVLVLLGEVG